jgi:hypothetical protein
MMQHCTIRHDPRLAPPASLAPSAPPLRNVSQSGQNNLSPEALSTAKTTATINSGPRFPPLLSPKPTSLTRFVPTRGIQTP